MSAAPAAEAVSAERLRLAVHEAGHAVACVLLGIGAAGVTIDLDGGGGVAFRPPRPFSPNKLLLGSVLLLDHGVQSRVQAEVMTVLAGPIAEALWAPAETGYRPQAGSERERNRLIDELERSGLPERIEAFEALPPLERQSDDNVIWKTAHAWTGSTNAAACTSRGCTPRPSR